MFIQLRLIYRCINLVLVPGSANCHRSNTIPINEWTLSIKKKCKQGSVRIRRIHIWTPQSWFQLSMLPSTWIETELKLPMGSDATRTMADEVCWLRVVNVEFKVLAFRSRSICGKQHVCTIAGLEIPFDIKFLNAFMQIVHETDSHIRYGMTAPECCSHRDVKKPKRTSTNWSHYQPLWRWFFGSHYPPISLQTDISNGRRRDNCTKNEKKITKQYLRLSLSQNLKHSHNRAKRKTDFC